MTRSVIPLLARRGIRAISVGVNGASAPPAVPRVFLWKDNVSTEELITLYHPGT